MRYTEVQPSYTYHNDGPVHFTKPQTYGGLKRIEAQIPTKDGTGKETYVTIDFHIEELSNTFLLREGHGDLGTAYRITFEYTPEDRKGARLRNNREYVKLLEFLTLRQAKSFLKTIAPFVICKNVWGEIKFDDGDDMKEALFAWSRKTGVDISPLISNHKKRKEYQEERATWER